MADTSTRGKRVRSSPTGITPQQPSKRKPRRKRKKKASASKRLSLCEAFPSTFSTDDSAWKREELRALVEFVVLHYDGDKWPHNKKDTFWNSAAEFVAERTSTSRTAAACRTKVTRKLYKWFHTPTDAAEFLKATDPGTVPGPSSPSTISHSYEHSKTPPPETCSHSGSFEDTIGQSTQALTTEVENWCTVPSSHPVSPLPPVPSTDDECCEDVEELASQDIDPSDPYTEHFKTPSPETRNHPSPFEDTIGLLATQVANWSMLPSSPPTSTVPSSGEEELSNLSPLRVETLDTHESIVERIQTFPVSQQLELVGRLFQSLALQQHGLYVPSDYLTLSLQGMQHLKSCGRENVLYNLAQGLGTFRDDSSDSRFPVQRMPMGLLQYMVDFYNADSYREMQGKCPDDYMSWLDTMYCLFGNKWSKLHRGPATGYERIEQGELPKHAIHNPVEARMNIPAPSERTIPENIGNSSFTTGAEIQTAILDEAHQVCPNSQWWIKADGCDLVSGLGESVQQVWGGDVDLADGKMQKMHDAYLKRLREISHITGDMSDLTERQLLIARLGKERENLEEDIRFIGSALEKTNTEYNTKLAKGKAQEKILRQLAWKVDELQRLNESGRKIVTESSVTMELLQDSDIDLVEVNMARKITALQLSLTEFVRGLSKHQRTAATHVWAILISPEERNAKPYALPVQCIPYVGLTDNKARELVNKVIQGMVNRGMHVAGLVTNGEFNSMRIKGNTRPLSVFQIRAQARAKYAQMGAADGTVQAKLPNPAVSTHLLMEIMKWKEEGAQEDDIITRLRPRTVPIGYTPTTWIPGEDETRIQQLRSILAQLEFQFQVCQWEDSGVPFRQHIYVPEIHPITGQEFHEREDEGHVFKRIGQSTRAGGPDELELERFAEALQDPASGLTYPALTGQRKQSIRDVEVLFSESMEHFMLGNGYTFEAQYIRVIRNWRRACDERGLSELQRCHYNYDLLNFLLDDLMPWHMECYDFSLLEVNRSLNGIRGLTRESLIAVTTDIESREWKRCSNHDANLPPEHPRASTTDDVECFFSVLRDMVGKHFTLKEVKFGWRKACVEFAKRLDPDLKFYYHTSSHDRFYEGPMPDFSQFQRPKRNPRHQRVRRREQPSSLMTGRASLVTPSARSIRMTYHNVPLELPPPPGSVQQHLSEHSYAY